MTNEDTLQQPEDSREPTVEDSTEAPKVDGEFKVTVRKLEVPARPRGVLAE